MNNNTEHRLEFHLSKEDIQHYIEGSLSRSGLRKIEEHLADCDLCSDALEGFRMLSTFEQNESVNKISAEINRKVHKKSQLVIAIRRVAAIAAVLLFCIGLTFYLNLILNNNSTQVSQNLIDKKKTELTSEDRTKSDTVFAETSKSIPSIIESPNGKSSGNIEELPGNGDGKRNESKNLKAPEPETENDKNGEIAFDWVSPISDDEKKINDDYNQKNLNGDNINKQENNTSLIPEGNENIDQDVTLPEIVTVTSPNNSYSGVPQYSPISTETLSKQKKNSNTKDEPMTGSEYKIGTTENLTDSTSIDKSSDLFNQAMEYKTSGENEKAIMNLNQVIKLNSKLKPQAMWEKANILFTLNKITEAKKVLKDLSEIDSPFQKQAKDKLLAL